MKKDYIDGLGDTLDLVPLGGYMGEGKRRGGYGAYLLGCYDAATSTYQPVCKLGSGFTDEQLAHWSGYFDGEQQADALPPWIDESSVGGIPPKDVPDTWLQPSVVWEVKAAEISQSPTFKAAAGLVEGLDASRGLNDQHYLTLNDEFAVGGVVLRVRKAGVGEGDGLHWQAPKRNGEDIC